MLLYLFLFIPFFFPSLMHFGRAALTNVTIDDTLTGPNRETVVYDPPSAWNSKGVCPGGTCSIAPDTSRILYGTWHESTFHAGPAANLNDFPNQPLSATANFRGSAVYVYAVLPPVRKAGASTTIITFYIDGVLVDEFSHTSAGPDYVYNVLVHASSSLSLGSHTITIANGKPNGVDSLFILDRIVYSTVVDDPQTPPPAPTGPAQPVSTAAPRGTISVSPSDQSPPTRLTESGEPNSTKPPDQSQTISLPGGSATDTTPPSATNSPPSSPTYSTFSSPSPSPNIRNGGNATSNRSLSAGAIVGAVLGSLAGVVAVLFMVLYCHRRHRSGPGREEDHQTAQPQDIHRSSLPSQPSSTVSAGWLVTGGSKREVLMDRSPPAYHET